MVVSKNIIMSERTSSRYEELYPKTVASQISDVYSKSETSNLFLPKSGGSMGGILDMSGNKITNLANPTESLDSANKKYVDESHLFKKIQILDKFNTSFNGRKDITATLPVGFSLDNILNVNFILYELYNVTEIAGGAIGAGMTTSESYELFSSGQQKTFSKITAVVPLSYKYYNTGDFYSIFSQKGNYSIRLFAHESGTNKLFFFASSQFSGKISAYFII